MQTSASNLPGLLFLLYVTIFNMAPPEDVEKLINIAIVEPEVRGNLLDGRIERAIEVAKREQPEARFNLDEHDKSELAAITKTASLGEFTREAKARGLLPKRK